MYNPQELQRKAQLNIHGVDTNAQTSLNNNNPPKQESEQNWFVRGLATIGNFVNNIVMGAVKSIEGIVDAGAMLVGLFGADVDDFVSYDFTADIFGADEEGEGLLEWSWGRNLADVSYLDNENIVNQIAEGVGGLLPTVAIGILTGGTSLAGTAASAGAKAATIGAKIAQTGTFVASAMGNASESALQDGADYNQALGYGALSGVTEGVIESISGGIGGTKMGTVLGKQIAKKTGTKLATTFIGEGLEEVASDLINPLYQRITGVNEEAKVDTNNLFRTFVVGGSIGAIMGGVGRKLTAHQNADKGGEKFLKVAEEVSEIEDAITEKENALTSENKTQEDIDGVGVKVVDKIINSVKTISDHLQSMTESQRSNALNIINGEESIVSNLFEVNGEIKSGVLEDLELSKKRHFSANSILKSQQINEELSNINQEKGWNLEVDDSQINENERVKLAQFYAVKNGLSEKTGKNLNFVMVKGLGAEAIDGFYSPNGKTIYITKDTLNNSLYKTTAHEVEHFVDNDLLQKYLINSAKNDGNNGKLFAEIVKKVVEDKNYGVTKEDIDSAIYKKSIGQKLSQQEELAYSELTAHLAENLLGNVDFIKRLARSNRGLFNKIKNFISDKVKTNSKSERYRMAEYLFDNALKEIKEKDVVKSEQFDKTNEIRYTIKNNSETITKQDYETLESDIMTWYMNQKGKILTHVKNGYDYYFVVNEDADSNGYMFTILSKSKAVNIHERETYYDEVKQHGERFNSFVSDFRSEQENSKFHLLSTDGRRAERTNRETNNRETERERIDGRHDSRNGFESGRNNQASKKVVHYDFENRTITYKDGTKAKFSLKETVEKDVVERYGKTYNWAETGYILTDGTRLDLSGRRDGATGGRRTVDHRDIFDIYEDVDGSDAMIEFMSRGNIRVSPEYPGINIQVEPNAEQYRLIQDLVERLAWRAEYFSVDLDNEYGDVVETLSYEGKVSGRKVVADIKYYFKEGKVPYQSELSKFRFSLKDSQDRILTEAQIEYFKDSKVRDEQGRLQVVYHATNNYEEKETWNEQRGYFDIERTPFTIFKKQYDEQFGHFFGKDINNAGGYGNRIYSVYLNIKNPLIIDCKGANYSYIKFNGEARDTYEWAEYAYKKGYDGVIFKNVRDGVDYGALQKPTDEYVAFRSNQIKNIDNKNPTYSADIRFSLKDNATYTLSDGQVKKKVANFTKLKVYSKVEAESIINSILETNFNLEDYSVRISGKTKAEAIDVLWKTLNTADAGKRTGISLKIADYIIDNTIIESIYLEEENQIYTETISFLKPYLHSVDLKALKGEIKYRYDTDNSVYLLWGKRKGEDGQTADQIAMELAESGFFIDAENEADIFFEMDRAYREAVRALKKKSDKFLADTLGKEERNKLRQDIAKDILRAFDSNGKKSKLAEIIEQQKERAKVWKDLYYEEKQRNSAINNLLYEVDKIRDIHFGDFQNSTQSHNLLFRGSIERLSAIKHRGDLNKSGTRSIVAGLNEWYSKDNPVVGDRFIEDISYILNKISSGTGKLTAEEIKGLATAVAYFRHFIETNNKIFRAGKYVDAKPIVEDYIKKIAETQNLKISWAGKVFDKLFNNSKLNYMQTFNDPMTIARYMDKYGDGFFTQTLESFREGAVNSAILEMELNASVEEFYDKHKKFLKNLKAKTVKYNNVEIPADKALYLYMALNREQALMGLARSGFSYKDDKGKTVRVAGFETNEDLTLDDIKIVASEVQTELEKQFNEAEIEYIKIAEKLFNEDCKKLKSERDKTRLGYSNVVDDYYIPIRRAYIAQSVDVDSLQFELDRVSNLSFNKSAVKGAKNELFIESLDLVLSRHLRGIAQYYHLSNVIDNFNIIYNMDIGGNANRVKSIASESVNVWDKGKTYLQDLISDIQGIKRGEGSRAFGWIRGSYAKYQLGANPKVWFTQLSSFFASTSILDYGSIVKGLAIKTNDVDKYCSLAKLRNNDNTAALAQGVLDKVDKVSNVLMKPIGMTDRLVVKKLFGACQVQVQKNTGLKIGTEENKVKAGELLQKVILETQQNTMATERSQAMRSSSELMKTLTMFTSDSMKVIGRVIDSYGELSILKARRKATSDANEKALLDKKIKTARKKAAKSTSALVTSAMFMALIAQAFRTLYNKDDEEDNIVENITVDAVGNLFGGLPIFKDVYAKIIEGYDFDGYQYSAINDLLDSVSNVIDLTGNIFSGNADSREVARNIKNMSYAIGQLFGIPVRNVYNVFYGLTKRVSPESAYKIDDVFYKQSYNSDLKKAIKNNDEEMIATIAGLIMDENIGAFENGSTRNEVNRLLSAGFDVLPQTVGNSMTINEVQYTLAGPQKENFKKVYSQSITAVDKLVSSNGYKIATDEAKAKAIKYIYKYYYYEAQHQALNVDLDSKLYLFGQIVPIEKMALALAEVPLLVENSTNKKTAVQRYLQASKLTSAQKYMLMGYFGYKNTKGEGVVKSAINKTSLTKEQKKLLLEKCGY